MLNQLGVQSTGYLEQIRVEGFCHGLVASESIADRADHTQRRRVLSAQAELDGVVSEPPNVQMPVHGGKECGVLRGLPRHWDFQRPRRDVGLLTSDPNCADLSLHPSTERTPSNLDSELIERLADHVVEIEAEDREHLLVASSDPFRELNRLFHALVSLVAFTLASLGRFGKGPKSRPWPTFQPTRHRWQPRLP